jgi:hypothetical protein
MRGQYYNTIGHRINSTNHKKFESVYIKIHRYFRWYCRKAFGLVRVTQSLIDALTMNSFLETTFVRRVIEAKRIGSTKCHFLPVLIPH